MNIWATKSPKDLLSDRANHKDLDIKCCVLSGQKLLRGKKFCDFHVFWHFLQNFLPRHNLNSKLVKVLLAKLQKILSTQTFFLLQYACDMKSWLGPFTEPLVSKALQN